MKMLKMPQENDFFDLEKQNNYLLDDLEEDIEVEFPEEYSSQENIQEKFTPKANEIEDGNIELIQGYELADDRGFYFVNIDDEKALIGIINSEIFVLKRFEKIDNVNLNIKKTESKSNKELYYVQVNKWKGLVSLFNNEMSLELEF